MITIQCAFYWQRFFTFFASPVSSIFSTCPPPPPLSDFQKLWMAFLNEAYVTHSQNVVQGITYHEFIRIQSYIWMSINCPYFHSTRNTVNSDVMERYHREVMRRNIQGNRFYG